MIVVFAVQSQGHWHLFWSNFYDLCKVLDLIQRSLELIRTVLRSRQYARYGQERQSNVVIGTHGELSVQSSRLPVKPIPRESTIPQKPKQ
jgi:hypothetical protein